MQYILLFAVILAIIVLVNVLMFLLIRSLSKQISEEAGNCLVRGLSFLDEAYEEKAQRLDALRAEEEKMLGKTTAHGLGQQLGAGGHAAGAEAPGTGKARAAKPVAGGKKTAAASAKAGYINRDLVAQYRYIKEHFTLDALACVEEVLAKEGEEAFLEYGATCAQMSALLTDSVVFDLLILPFEEQIQRLDALFTQPQKEIALAFFEENPAMDVVLLKDRLLTEAKLYSDAVTVLAADPAELAGMNHGEKVQVLEDATLCEGVKIIRGSKVYDYSF